MSNVIYPNFNVKDKIDVPIKVVLDAAKDLDRCLILGVAKDGSFHLSANRPNMADFALWMAFLQHYMSKEFQEILD